MSLLDSLNRCIESQESVHQEDELPRRQRQRAKINSCNESILLIRPNIAGDGDAMN